jgi:hypothetical protein
MYPTSTRASASTERAGMLLQQRAREREIEAAPDYSYTQQLQIATYPLLAHTAGAQHADLWGHLD